MGKKKKNVLLITIFVVIIISIFSVNEFFSKKGYDGSSWDVFEKLPKDSLDLIFLGNSHNYTSFDPVIINNALDVNSFVLGTPNSTLPLMYFELNKVLKTQSPKYIVIETYVFDAIENDTFHINYLHRSSFDFDDFRFMFTLFEPNDFFKFFISTTHHETYWKEPFAFILDKYFNRPKIETDYLGFHSTPSIINKEEFEALRELKGTTPKIDISERDEYQYYLEKILQLCEENDVELILTSIPVVTDYRNKSNLVLVDYDSFVEKFNLSYINLGDGDLDLSWMNFYNNGHLSMQGSINTTVEFAKRFSSLYFYPLNTKYINKFSDFHFVDHEIEINNGFMTIRLVPKTLIPNNAIQYYWNIQH